MRPFNWIEGFLLVTIIVLLLDLFHVFDRLAVYLN
jgi:hypothetical protein